MKNKLKVKKIANEGKYNELDLEKNELFLDSLQDFVAEIGLEEIEGDPYEFDGKKYGMRTFYNLFLENRDGDFKKKSIENFNDGELIRYSNKKN